MTERVRRSESTPNKEVIPEYYLVLELDEENPSPQPLVIGKRQANDERWSPDIDLPNHLGLFESSLAPQQVAIDAAGKLLTVSTEAFGKTYHNGKLLEGGESVPLQDGDMVNITDIQLFIRFVPSTGTAKPYFLYTICNRIPLYTQNSDKPKTPWNPQGYTPDETVFVPELQKQVPLWLVKEAHKDARTWDLDAMDLLGSYLEAVIIERQKAAGSSNRDRSSRFPERFQRLMEKINDKHQENKKKWLYHHIERKPVYPPTQEEGSFVGIFGYLVSAWSAREFPYYQTPSGIYFYEWVDDEGKNKKVIKLDLDDMIEQQAGLFFSSESWLEHRPIDLRKHQR